jgi:protein phosphatase
MTTPNPNLPEAVAATSRGRVRTSNEDAFGYRTERGIFLVCDGMGGAAGGEVASRIAVDTVLQRMCTDSAAEDQRGLLSEAIAEANRAVLERADQDAGLYGMGTTLVALQLRHAPPSCDGQESGSGSSRHPPVEVADPDCPGTALIAHAGDSRCYLWREGRLTRLTNDHSLVDEQLRLGTMTREEAERSPFRSVITRAIGTQQTVSEEIQEMETEPEDIFLLCTDGLTREVDEDTIARVLGAGRNLEAAAHRLVESANEAGGRDNVTCVLVRLP